MAPTSTEPFIAPEARPVVNLLSPALWSGSWSGTSAHVGIAANCIMVLNAVATPWSVPFDPPASTAAETVARLRDRSIEAAGLTKQDVARAVGIDRRSLSGFVTGEIRPSEQRIRALELLVESAEWAATRFGIRARDVLKHGTDGAPLDLIAAGRISVISEMEAAAAALGLIRRGAISIRTRSAAREPLYLSAREAWSTRVDKPQHGGTVRDPAVYEQDLSNAARGERKLDRPRRKRI